MDAGPVAPRPVWRLRPEEAASTQGLVVSGFGGLATGLALFLELGAGVQGGGWLRALQTVAPINAADVPKPERAAALSLAWVALQRMGLPEAALASFPRPYREGMFQEDRARRLGDKRLGEWLETVVPGGPRWSANTAGGVTPLTVHAVLLLYTADTAAAEAWAAEVEATLAPHGVSAVHRLPLVLDVDGQGISREHFGFADGLSQPQPYDAEGAVLLGDKPATTADPVQGVPLGEVLLGHVNGYHEKAPGPVVPGFAADGVTEDKRPGEAGLLPAPEALGFHDFGRNGSYMVVRELKQDVAAFWQSMAANAARIRATDPAGTTEITADWIAERVVGRDQAGHLLCPMGAKLPPGPDGTPDSDYLFYPRDPRGLGCPAGSHVRRANPRDSLAPTKEMGPTLLQAANNHRLLRRGRKYGPKIADPRVDDGADRGLLFMCLNADIERQFEFVQHVWLLNSDFNTLYGEVDPLVGPPSRMTIRETALRRTLEVQSFVQMVGGDYFFLPSLPALRYLALL